MANVTGLGGSSKTSQKMRTTSGEKLRPEMGIKKFNLNNFTKAREYFSLREQFILGPTELNQAVSDQMEIINIIDVRKPEDYARGHLPGAINLTREQWQSGAGLKKDKVNVIYCYNLECPLAAKAAMEFASKGYAVMELVGGYTGWKENHYKTETQVHH
jgi:rhodanese-related sulfurtransferase